MTGRRVLARTPFETLPSNAWPKMLRPREPTTIRSTSRSSAMRQISATGSPKVSSKPTSTSCSSAIAFASRSGSSSSAGGRSSARYSAYPAIGQSASAGATCRIVTSASCSAASSMPARIASWAAREPSVAIRNLRMDSPFARTVGDLRAVAIGGLPHAPCGFSATTIQSRRRTAALLVVAGAAAAAFAAGGAVAGSSVYVGFRTTYRSARTATPVLRRRRIRGRGGRVLAASALPDRAALLTARRRPLRAG